MEIKAKISNINEIKEKFKKSSGIYKLSLYHEDLYFNMPKGLRDFANTDEALRIRKSIEFQKNSNDSRKNVKYYLTYKGKKIDKSTKSRKELEVSINDGIKMKEILNLLGFQDVITVKKERELYEFNYKGNEIAALIDYIPDLEEYFIEVEIIIDSIDKLGQARDLLFEFLMNFNIKREESIRKSYLELIIEKIHL